MARNLIVALLGLLLLVTTAHAQFQFFEQMFGGGGQQQQEQEERNVPSDSAWYQNTWNNGKPALPSEAQQ
jgi:hypothetical protein